MGSVDSWRGPAGDDALGEMKVNPEESEQDEDGRRVEGELIKFAGRKVGESGGRCFVGGHPGLMRGGGYLMAGKIPRGDGG